MPTQAPYSDMSVWYEPVYDFPELDEYFDEDDDDPLFPWEPEELEDEDETI